jgi:hypothetical protein
MLAYLLFILAVPHPGGTPTNWQPLLGEPSVRYRWARPSSNSCLVEFASDNPTAGLTFQSIVKVITNRPESPVSQKSLSPLRAAPTVIVPQTSDREISIQLVRMGQDARDIPDCYGIQMLKGSKKDGGTTESEPLSRAKAK